MPRVIRYQYPGAVYHLMARGEGGKVVFENDEDQFKVTDKMQRCHLKAHGVCRSISDEPEQELPFPGVEDPLNLNP